MSFLNEEEEAILAELIAKQKAGQLSGMFPNIPDKVYHHPRCPGISNSNFTEIERSYDHYIASLDKAEEATEEEDYRDKFFLGRAFHMRTLEPDRFFATFAHSLQNEPVEPKFDKRTNAGKAAYAEWYKKVYNVWEETELKAWADSVVGKVILPYKLWLQIETMAQKSFANPCIKSILDRSLKEITVFWSDEKTGITCKARFDAVDMDFAPDYALIFDFKSTEDASRLAARKSIVKWNYDRQAAFYCEGLLRVTGKKSHFVWGFQEKDELFLNQCFMANDAMKEVGQNLFRRGLDKLSGVHKKNEVRGYSTEISDIDLPAYAFDLDAR